MRHLRYGFPAASLLFFCVAFYLPLSSKAINNIFYIGLAAPALGWLLWRPRALDVLARGFAWVIFPLIGMSLLAAGSLADLKAGLYFLLFLFGLLMLDEGQYAKRSITAFAILSVLLLCYLSFDWAMIRLETGQWIRYHHLLGEVINPVHFALLITTALAFLWLFHAEPWLSRYDKRYVMAGFTVLTCLVLLSATLFQARSALLGFGLFTAAYLFQRKMLLPMGAALLVAGLLLLPLLSLDELLAERGTSYRPEIWADTLHRLRHDCGLIAGCGTDDHLFAGRFPHPHNGYLATLYQMGLPGFALFTAFAAVFIWRSSKARSRWALIAWIGWGALLTTSNGMFTSPKPLWIYFWLPTFLAILESQPNTVRDYFAKRHALSAEQRARRAG
ncbi:O-antigen ligase family protein [Stutzerimonas tarimensis]|uniref:O-antigen ligase family protein n=1 Tax=Stutzerimonas tarimensis TaxID=1507735 RepID=A0ABV7T5E5_9GAMM